MSTESARLLTYSRKFFSGESKVSHNTAKEFDLQSVVFNKHSYQFLYSLLGLHVFLFSVEKPVWNRRTNGQDA